MDDIFFTESSEAPVPPNEVRIRALKAMPRPDGQRILTEIEISPFQQKPNVELIIRDKDGEELSSLSVVEAMDPKMDFTMHIRGEKKTGTFTLKARLFYADIEKHEKGEDEEAVSGDIIKEASRDIDELEITFTIE